jgi:hypothetical protein
LLYFVPGVYGTIAYRDESCRCLCAFFVRAASGANRFISHFSHLKTNFEFRRSLKMTPQRGLCVGGLRVVDGRS